MKKKRILYFIVALMSVSLLLIITMQGGHIIRSYNEKSELVDRDVREALAQALRRLEKQDALFFVYDKMQAGKSQYPDSTYPVDPNMTHGSFNPASQGFSGGNFSISISSANGGTHVVEFSNALTPDGFLSYSVLEQYFSENSGNTNIDFDALISEIEKEYEIRRRPIESRFDKAFIETVIQKELSQQGLDLDFEFAVLNGNQEIKIRSDNFSDSLSEDAYKINLTPGNILSNPDALYVYFPNKRKYVLEGIYAQILTSVVFTLIIIITFGITLMTVIRQKKLTDIKNDFINNMTHEFKTPLATIQLAAASIKNPKIRENQAVVEKFTDIISQETQRMNQHVEQVLQMALLDRESLKLKKEPVDMHELITDAVSNIELIIAEREGRIRAVLKAEKHVITADKDTLMNVVNNLLDNANKYSTDAPDITVYSYNRNGQFVFEVEDKGIGMNKEVQNKVFDKFYRASTGNIHNIKGFGLGLNYVREIVMAHKGDIQIKSQASRGSTFTIILPMQQT